MGAIITINKDAARARIKSDLARAMPIFAEQVLADCNKYCRVDQGTLRGSSERASDLKKGLLVWDTPYARRVYYTGKPSLDSNPNAARQWCEVAASHHAAIWEKLLKKLMTGITS